MDIEKILLEKYNATIPNAPTPGGIYSPARQVGNLIFLSGQTPTEDGVLRYVGSVGDEFGIREGQAAARMCALNLLSVLKSYLNGDFSRVKQIVQLIGYVRSAKDFSAQPQVINGASQLFVDIFGEAGRASRLALGTNELPGGAPVEVMIIAEIQQTDSCQAIVSP